LESFIKQGSDPKEHVTREPQTGHAAAQNNHARQAMLRSIREHLEASAPFDKVHAEGHAPQNSVRASGQITRTAVEAPAELFRQALEAVNGKCTIVTNETEAATSLRQAIELYQLKRIAVSDSPTIRHLLQQAGGNVTILEDAEAKTLFDCDAGVTGAQWGIAETGTLVLESKDERHRLVSLVPPVHIGIIPAGQIRRTMAEVLEAVSREGDLSRALTFITGPSRTSDIELTLAIGVHGPGKLHVIVIQEVEPTV